MHIDINKINILKCYFSDSLPSILTSLKNIQNINDFMVLIGIIHVTGCSSSNHTQAFENIY